MGVAMALAATVCWGIGNVMVRQPDLHWPQLAFWRMLLGAGVTAALLAATRRRLSWTCIRACWPAGAALAGWILCYYLALLSTTVTDASLISSLLPVFLLGVAKRRFGERISLSLVGMVAAALAGIALALYGSSAVPSWSLQGDGMALVSTLLFALHFALAKQARQRFTALEFQTAIYVVASVILLPVEVIDARGFEIPDLVVWEWIAALVIVPGTGHLLMNWAHRHVALSITSTITLASTPVSAIGAALFLDEPIVVIQAVGLAVTLVALATVIEIDLHPVDHREPA